MTYWPSPPYLGEILPIMKIIVGSDEVLAALNAGAGVE
jgi:hypothetical protein